MKKKICYFTCIILIISIIIPNFTAKATLIERTSSQKYIIFININELTLSLVNSDTKKFEKVYPIAIGKKNTPSPIGTWQISSKALMKGPFGGYFLGLNVPWDTFGIHGTSNPNSIGHMASNGCIRMYNWDIKEVFFMVDYGTSVIIYSGPSYLFSPYVRIIKPNDKGTDVYWVEKRLNDLGYFKGIPDGIYDYDLQLSVLKYKKEHDLKYDPYIDEDFLNSVGIFKFE